MISYEDSGVNIDRGNAFTQAIKPFVKSTQRTEVLGSIGGFGGLCKIPTQYNNPILVSGTDGVGTKLKLAIELGLFETIGIDLVAMCVNDILVLGAEPLFFLDYYATGKLDVDHGTAIVKGIADGCKQAGCALIGGETAEMPGLYQENDFDLAGFTVGIVEESQIIKGDQIKAGDVMIGLPSSGIHSNGYSLVRKLIADHQIDLHQPFQGDQSKPLGQTLLEPTQIYVSALLPIIHKQPQLIKGMAHITGGGLTENLPRSFPDHLTAQCDLSAWKLPPIFNWLADLGPISQTEMLKTFNCGVGMVVWADEANAEQLITEISKHGLQPFVIGSMIDHSDQTHDAHMSYSGSLF